MRFLLALVFATVLLVASNAEADRFHGIYRGRSYLGHHHHHNYGRSFAHYGRSYFNYGRSYVGLGHGHLNHYRPYYSSYRIRSYYAAPRVYLGPSYYTVPRYYGAYDPYCATGYGAYYGGVGVSPLWFGGLAQPQVNLYVNNPPAAPAPAPAPTAPLRERRPEIDSSTALASKVIELRNSSLKSRALARSLMTTGDQMFREQRYHSALQKYKAATKAAPDLAETHFRQGHGYIATNRYEQAAQSFKLGAALASDVNRGGFKLDDLYSDSPISKTAHLDALAEEALDDEGNTDLLFLVGVYLYYDNQADRAERFFDEAARVSPRELRYLAKYRKPQPRPSEPIITASLPSEVEL